MLDERSKEIISFIIRNDPLANSTEKDELISVIKGSDAHKKSYTVKEVAVMISKSSATIYNLVSSGKLDAIRTGKSNRISSITRDSLERYISGKQNG